MEMLSKQGGGLLAGIGGFPAEQIVEVARGSKIYQFFVN